MRYAPMIAAAAMLGMLSLALARQPTPATAPARQSFDAIIKGLKEVPSDPTDNELRAKLKERHNSAVKLLQLRSQEYQKGLRDLGNVFDAARTVVDCKLDLAQSPQERQQMLEEVVNVAKSVEDLLQKQAEKGLASQSELERARLGRISAEVQLLRARQPATTQSAP